MSNVDKIAISAEAMAESLEKLTDVVKNVGPTVVFVQSAREKIELETAMRLNGLGGFDIQVAAELPEPENNVVMVGGCMGGKTVLSEVLNANLSLCPVHKVKLEGRTSKGDRRRKRQQ